MSATKKNAATKAVEQVEAAVAASKDSVETAVKAGNDAAVKNYEKAVALTKEQFDAAFKAGAETFKSVKGYEQAASFGQDNVEAAFESSAMLAKGVQDFNTAWFELAQSSFDDGLATAKKIMGCKTAQEVFETQAAAATSQYNKLVDDGRKLTDLSAKVVEQAAQPLAGRVNAAVDQLTKSQAV